MTATTYSSCFVRFGWIDSLLVMDRCDDDALLTEQELADWLKVGLRTVQRWRYDGTGPPVLWAGNRPRYRRGDVRDWLRRRDHDA